jgi:hypothetical protein
MYCAIFTPDGRNLLSIGHADQTVKIWPAAATSSN